jgi:2-amino-4-hydroxy-6-hydroxymethyldihydropteridine diphosphokinase
MCVADSYATIAFGGNHPSTLTYFQKAISLLADKQIICRKFSSLYRSYPWGYKEQSDFYNAVGLFQCPKINSHQLLALLLEVESNCKRERSFENAPRTLDLDLIDHMGQCIESSDLLLPHPRAHLRDFVLLPIFEIDPDWVHPGSNSTVTELISHLKESNLFHKESSLKILTK